MIEGITCHFILPKDSQLLIFPPTKTPKRSNLLSRISSDSNNFINGRRRNHRSGDSASFYGKRIVKLDRDINEVTSEALSLISSSTGLFLRFLTEKSAEIAIEKKRKAVKLDHIRVAAIFSSIGYLWLLIPPINQWLRRLDTILLLKKPGTRRIDDFFAKSTTEAPVQINDS